MKSDLLNLLKILSKSNLDFVLVGGFAGVVHGSSELTRDVDVCIHLDQDSVNELRLLLSSLNPVHRMHPKKLSFLKYPESTKNLKNLYLSTDLGVLDILSEIKGLGLFNEVVKEAQFINIDQQNRIKVLSRQQLIIAKKSMGRPKDLRVVEELESID